MEKDHTIQASFGAVQDGAKINCHSRLTIGTHGRLDLNKTQVLHLPRRPFLKGTTTFCCWSLIEAFNQLTKGTDSTMGN